METGSRDQVDITSQAFTSTMRHMTALSHQAGGAPANGEVGWARRSGEANGPMSKIDAHLSRVYVDYGGRDSY